MPALRISCFGILLKLHLLRHHGEEVAPRGRLRPEISTVLAAFPPVFDLINVGELPSHTGSCVEQRLTLRLELKGAELIVYGLLARRGADDPPSLLPCSMRFNSQEHQVTLPASIIRDSLSALSSGKVRVKLESESRVGLFQPTVMDARSQKKSPGDFVRKARLSRVA